MKHEREKKSGVFNVKGFVLVRTKFKLMVWLKKKVEGTNHMKKVFQKQDIFQSVIIKSKCVLRCKFFKKFRLVPPLLNDKFYNNLI